MKLLLTGASSMLGHYIRKEFADMSVTTLGRGDGNDIICDLAREIPILSGSPFDIVVHCAGTHDAAQAMAVNLEGTRHLLQALEASPPHFLVIVSSYEVYSPGSEPGVSEEDVKWATDEVGRSKALAEAETSRWAGEREGVVLTIVRPARMFGSGLRGEMARMFAEVIAGRYVHIRGEEGRISVVTAFDVAKAIRKLYPVGGVYNLSDGLAVDWRTLAEAMSANAGKFHRPTTIPRQWVPACRALFGWLPVVKEQLSEERLLRHNEILTLDNSRAEQTGVDFFNTVKVIRREAPDYPYEDE